MTPARDRPSQPTRPVAAPRLPSADQATDLFRRAAEANRNDPLRDGNLLRFPDYGQLVMTGDLHGHAANFAKLRRYAMLDRVAARHVLLHELIHAETAPGEPDRSHALLLEAARWKLDHPDQVHFLQSNHELSQLTDHPILKNGRVVLEDFRRGVYEGYVPRGEEVYRAICEFLASFPLAGRTHHRVWVSHSLPAEEDLADFDAGVFGRPLCPLDLAPGGPVYRLVWGRRFSPGHLEALARLFDADFFIVGHQPQESGSLVAHGRLIILASDHNHGSFLPVDLARPCTLEYLAGQIQKFVAVA